MAYRRTVPQQPVTQQPVPQQPGWPDSVQLRSVTAELAAMPPLVFPGECDLLRQRLAAVAAGEAAGLESGDKQVGEGQVDTCLRARAGVRR